MKPEKIMSLAVDLMCLPPSNAAVPHVYITVRQEEEHMQTSVTWASEHALVTWPLRGLKLVRKLFGLFLLSSEEQFERLNLQDKAFVCVLVLEIPVIIIHILQSWGFFSAPSSRIQCIFVVQSSADNLIGTCVKCPHLYTSPHTCRLMSASQPLCRSVSHVICLVQSGDGHFTFLKLRGLQDLKVWCVQSDLKVKSVFKYPLWAWVKVVD